MAETWVINESPNFNTLSVNDVPFVSNNNDYNTFVVDDGSSFPPSPYGIGITYAFDYTATAVCYDNPMEGKTWLDQAYRTVTFDTAPTGDLLTWLQANAVKQEPLITDDLTGWTWVGNETLSQPTFEVSEEYYYIDFNCPADDYNTFDNIYLEWTEEDLDVYYGSIYRIYLSGNWYDIVSGEQITYELTPWKEIHITGGTDVTNTDLIKWLQDNGTLTPPVTGYSVTYHSNGGTPIPTDLEGQTALPDTLPTVSKENFVFDGWYYDELYENEAHGGDTLDANVDLYAKFTRSHITLDLSTLSLPEGIHSIQMRLSDDGVTKADSELSNAVEYTPWEDPIQNDDNLTIKQVYQATKTNDTLEVK